jgi:hypothetical protein
MPVECGLLARAGAASRCARKTIHDAHERRASAGIASSRPRKGREKFFCIIVQNPLPIAPDAGRIARIGGVPIRYSDVSRRDRDDQVARKCALRGRRRARTASIRISIAWVTCRSDDRGPRSAVGHAITPAFGEHARAESGSALRRSRSFGYVEPHIGASCAAAKRLRGLQEARVRRRAPANRGCARRGWNIIRFRAWPSADRSPLAGSPCRRTTSSLARRTSRPSRAWPWPAPPCPGWRR